MAISQYAEVLQHTVNAVLFEESLDGSSISQVESGIRLVLLRARVRKSKHCDQLQRA